MLAALLVLCLGAAALTVNAALIVAKRERAMTERNDLAPDLIAAAARGDGRRVEDLIAAGAPINVQDERGRTPVMAATYGNHVDAVAALLRAGADVNIRDGMLNNPFLYAGAEGHLDILKLTYAAGADPTLTNRFGGTALIPAAERGHVAVVRYLLTETTVDVNHVNRLGWTALLEAIMLGDGGPRHQQIVALLIAHGADVNLADKDGVTPLAHARARGYRAIETQLTAAGAGT
jgi:ankyrin repeat protein